MPDTAERPGTRLADRAEYRSKPRPLTGSAQDTVASAVQQMSDKNYGCIVITDGDGRVEGIVTERDIMTKIVAKARDAANVTLGEIMTREPRLAREEDDMLDWLRIMSNERFRRLPVIDSDGRIKALFTQGDFVSYTWPDLLNQAKSMAKATVLGKFHLFLIGGGVLLYALGTLVVLAVS